jgi:ribonuclease HIII
MVTKSGRSANSDSKPSSCIYTKKLNAAQFQLLHALYMGKSFEKYQLEYAKFALKGNGANIVAYESGKVVIQGKKTEEFI